MNKWLENETHFIAIDMNKDLHIENDTYDINDLNEVVDESYLTDEEINKVLSPNLVV